MLPPKLVILDRDGCLNRLGEQRYVLNLSDFELYDDVDAFFNFLKNSEIAVAIATNQQCIALNLLTFADLDLIHSILREKTGYNREEIQFFVCPHLENTCKCRKPEAGLLLRAMNFYGVNPKETIFIGDQLSDLLAARNARVQFIALDREKRNTFLNSGQELVCSSLLEIISYIKKGITYVAH
jgi:D-glycero-D-manno-heptose 1,7-bisphosphate phosphatase